MILSAKNSDTYPVTMVPYSPDSFMQLQVECMYQEIFGKKRYLNVASAFDTETTSFIDSQDKEETALCYIWMFGIGDTVVYGRELDEFVDLINKLNNFLETKETTLITYVHFLKFDFSFIKRLFNWNVVFSKKNRDPLYARTRNIEFRDSLVLAGGKSLAFVGAHLKKPVYKAVGDLDYELPRHSKTPLTQAEMHYCEMDIRVLIAYIREKIEEDGNINKIPYTNTGYVRNYVRNECFKDRARYLNFIDGLTITPDCYMQAEAAFTGGAVGPNIKKVGQVIENVHSYDIKSSYPYVMCTGYYPISYFKPVPNKQTVLSAKNYMDEYCCLFTLEVWDLAATTDYCFPISYHKCEETIGEQKASGRIISAMYLRIQCTELDYKTWEKFYNLNSTNVRITRFRIAPRGFLPLPIVRSVVEFFNKKTTLDGVEGREQEYMLSKNMLNSVYGMMVEKPVRPLYGYINQEDFYKKDPDYVSAVVEYNEKPSRFLFYPWGIWVTAHARYRLYDAIYNVGDDFVYCDTDSVKFTGNHTVYFEYQNALARNEIYQCAMRNGFDIDYIVPKSPRGEQKWLGVWEHEYDAVNFKTIGAKRYLIERANNNYELTVAGTNKKSTLEYIIKLAGLSAKNPFDIFDENLVIPAEYAKRTTSKFIDDTRTGWITDYLGNKEYYVAPSGVYVAPASYSFSITEEMKEAIIWLVHEGHWQDGEIT